MSSATSATRGGKDEDRRADRRHEAKDTFITFILILGSNCFVITVSFLVFFSVMYSMDGSLTGVAAPLTFLNVLFVTVLFTIVHVVRHHFTVTIPVRQIRQGLQAITDGNLAARIEPVNATDEFDPIIEDINRMAAELSSVETLKTDFVSTMSHEIKTPVAVIANYSQMMQEENLSPAEYREYAATIAEASARLSTLVGDILRLNRLENQTIRLDSRRFDLSGNVTESLLGFETVWEERNIDIEPDIDDDVMVESDPQLLEIVWNNLLSNAFKFTPDGGTVGVSVKRDGDHAVVSVSDSGCGMTPDVGRHIFEKFYQGDPSRAAKGNGLGLALVKRIIDLTGASIGVESELGKGSTFTVRLPLSGE